MPPHTKPSWLELAACSDKHITNVLRVLAARESKRYMARVLSQQRQLDPSESIPIVKPRSALATFLRHEPDVQPHHVEHYSVAAGVQEENREMNRYLDIIPYDRTCFIVEEDKDHPQEQAGRLHGRYLNANWVMERFGHKWWIATQAPLRNTAHAFLSVMLQPVVRPPHADPPKSKTTRIRTVVQLTQNFESGRKKADPYFPSEVGKSLLVPPEEGCYAPALKVTLLDQRVFKKAHCVQSTVSISPYHPPAQRASKESRRRGSGQTDLDQSRVEDVGEEVIFRHLLYLSWPDHGVPEPKDRDSLLEFIKLVDHTNRDKAHCSIHSLAPPDHQCSDLDPDPPIIVGCSAGVGRTGSFLALSSLLRNYGFLPPAQPTSTTIIHDSPLGPLPNDLKDDLVLQEIDSLREQRPGMVQKTEQTLLIYEVLSDVFAKSP